MNRNAVEVGMCDNHLVIQQRVDPIRHLIKSGSACHNFLVDAVYRRVHGIEVVHGIDIGLPFCGQSSRCKVRNSNLANRRHVRVRGFHVNRSELQSSPPLC
jgi:hypothetical protein